MSSVFSQPFAGRTFLWRSRAWISLAVVTPAAVLTVFSAPRGELHGSAELACGVFGWLMFATGAIFRWWASLYISGRKDAQVVCDGPYSLVRHPLYLGTCLMGLSIAVFLQSLVFLVALLVTGFIYLGITLPREEQRLVAIYGDAYRAYMARVPRLWPRWSNYRTPGVIEVHTSGLQAELLRMARWMWIPLVSHLLLHLRTEAWWPHWVSLW